jgi:hypothetical protein
MITVATPSLAVLPNELLLLIAPHIFDDPRFELPKPERLTQFKIFVKFANATCVHYVTYNNIAYVLRPQNTIADEYFYKTLWIAHTKKVSGDAVELCIRTP